jgi:hypothetical protein
MRFARIGVLLTCSAIALLGGCSNQKPEPLTASSAGESGYAERYPDELAATRGGFTEQEGSAQRVIGEFSTYPDELDNPSWPGVTQVVERADQAGKSSAYVERLHQNDAVVQFFAEEQKDIDNAVAGAVQYAAKEKNVDAEGLPGAATGALKRSVDKQLEDRLRDHNEAHRYIEDNQEALGKKNVEALKKQADKIAYVSYIVNVSTAETREKLQRLIDEASQVKSTLDDDIEESNKTAADESRGKDDRAAAKKRAEAATAAKAKIDSEIQQAQSVLQDFDNRANKLKTDYQTALDALKQKIDEKASAAPPAAAAKSS